MDPTYSVTIEPDRRLLRITLSGFFSTADVIALENAKRAGLVRLRCGANQHYTLVDVSACKLQPQDVVGAFQVAIADRRYMAKRIAFVTGSSLSRMQVRRMMNRDDARLFDSVDEAEEWLFHTDALRATG